MIQEIGDVLNSVNMSVAAAWIQSIGSIAAIFVAIWISNIQYRNSIKLEKEKGRRIVISYIEASISFGGAVLQKVQQLDRWIHTADPDNHKFDYLRTEVETFINELNQIAIFQISNFKIVENISRTKALCNVSHRLIVRVEDAVKNENHWIPMAISELGDIESDLEKSIKDLIGIRGKFK